MTCSIDGCERPFLARGWCSMHYQRWYHFGDPLREITPADRFFAKVDVGDCWLWTGSKAGLGYGQFSEGGGHQVLAHRWAYEFLVGPIPPGYDIDHLCRVKACVNPDHLEPVTPRENIHRSHAVSAINARKTYCIRGHYFDEANTYLGDGNRRVCRTCGREKMRRFRARRREAA